jgi:hypothetical protein
LLSLGGAPSLSTKTRSPSKAIKAAQAEQLISIKCLHSLRISAVGTRLVHAKYLH